MHGRLNIDIKNSQIEEKNGEFFCYLRAVYDRTPLTMTEKVLNAFKNLELMEKIAEIGDESFHLFGSLIQSHTSVIVYQTFRNLHHAAHDIENVLHSFCFLGDLFRLFSGKFFEFNDKERKHFFVLSIGRICIAFSHFLATATFISMHQVYQFGRLEPYFKYIDTFSAIGYGIWTVSLIWRRFNGEKNKHFYSDMGIYFAGCLFKSFTTVKNIALFAPYINIINKISAITGINHAYYDANRLIPKNKENIHAKFKIPVKRI